MVDDTSTAPLRITSEYAPDLGHVERFIRQKFAEGALAVLLATVMALLARMRDLNAELLKQIALGRRIRPPSERMCRLQMELPLWAEKDAANDGEPATEKKKPKKRGPKTKHRHGRAKLPEHLERKTEQHFVDDVQRVCACCKSQTSHVKFVAGGERLDIEPARFIVRVDHMEMRACQHCHDYIVTAPRPDTIVERGALGDDLIVESTVDHYEDGVPWERMQRRAREQGVPLSANTLAAASGCAIDLLDPIVRHIFDKALQSKYFGFDATGVRVLDVSHPLGIRNGVMWLLQGDHVYSCFKYADSGHAHHLKALLKGATFATAMCDGAATNNCVERHGATRGGCNSHARRKLVEALRVGDARAMEGLELFARIFHVDAEAKRAGETIEQRFARRQRDSVLIIAELETWMKARRRDVEPKSALGRAVRYMDKQWARLTAFLHDPRMELSNNEVERDLRTWVLSRKVWLFCGHDESAQRAAAALTIITTCRKMGIDPRHYMRDTLRRLLAGEKDINVLLPENYKPHISAVHDGADGVARQTAAA
jgi:transposase